MVILDMENSDELKIIRNIKSLALDMINKAGSGHPGIVLGAAPIIYTLFAKHLNIIPLDDEWANRDRFVLSAGHGSALLYSTLYMAGYDIPTSSLKKFREVGSILPGHPEIGITPGVEVTTGPLGQGIAMAVGMAMAERYLGGLLEKELPNQKIINHYTYVLCGDGDLMEGVSYEATSFAGVQKLGKLIILYDSNDICLDGPTKKTFKEDIKGRFKALGWHTQLIDNDINSIDNAIKNAKKITDAPSLIEIKTIIGEDSVNAGKNQVHGTPLDQEDYLNIKKSFGLSTPFKVDEKARDNFRNAIESRTKDIFIKWQNDIKNIKSNEKVKRIIDMFKNKDNDITFNIKNLKLPKDYVDEMRNSNQLIMNMIGLNSLFFLGGSADLASSCKNYQKESGEMNFWDTTEKNIPFGVREHAMAGILNGMSTYGLYVYGSTFLVFSDYQKAAIRLSALMKLPVTYIYTHDSIVGGNGPDGATHLSIEQLSSLRSIPDFSVFRPADINEIAGSWKCILNGSYPAALIIGKNKQSILNGSSPAEVAKGGYIISKETNKLDAIIIATGSEVDTAIKISESLKEDNIDVRVVSMPSVESFELQSSKYKSSIIPPKSKIITLEASNDPVWYKYASNNKNVISVSDFAYSGNNDDILHQMGFDFKSLKSKIEKLIK